MRFRAASIVVMLSLLVASTAVTWAQGVQTGTIRGVVRDEQNLPVPGVTVTVTSPALQGVRTAASDGEGNYTIPALPAGTYEVTFEISSFSTVKRTSVVALGLAVEQDVVLRAAGVAESVQVVAEVPGPIATPVVGANFTHDEIEALATPRTLQGIAALAPAVNEISPNANQLVINGAFAYDNVFMINGVDVNDNLSAQPNNLFIEDAIQETQVLTSGISAEYGRFSGGVVNAITKSGGNRFSGSARLNFQNPSWTTRTPFEESQGTNHLDVVSRIYEGTFGGPIVRDTLWFFAAGRHAELNNQVVLPQTGISLPSLDSNKRGEIKLTGRVLNGHTLQGGYLNNPRTRTNNSGAQSLLIDPRSEVDRTNPNWYYFTNYHGVLGGRMLLEGQYSERRLRFAGDGGTSTNIFDSPFFALSCACVYNGPILDATDPGERNNRQFTGSVMQSWTRGGRHDTKAGYEFYRSQLVGGNSQSSTQYVFTADFATDAAGRPRLDSNGRLIPVFVPGVSYVDYWPATRGATLNIDNQSAYVQDHWVLGRHWSADIGVRFEHVKSLAVDRIIGVQNNRVVPRLAAAFDVQGNGNHVVHATYGQYAGRYNEAQVRVNSPVGNPPQIEPTYRGPAGQGVDFAPGFDIANYPITPGNASVTDGTQNVSIDSSLKSPLTHEFSTSYGLTLPGDRGYAEVSYIYRKTTSLMDDFISLEEGITAVTVNGVPAGRFTNHTWRNADEARREYQAMVFQSRYRLTDRWNVNGHYTLQLKNDGNFEGESTNSPGNPSLIGNFPEALSAARFFPDGRLQSFQRSRLRLWTIYTFDMSRFGNLSLSGLVRAESGLAYSLVARNQAITAQQRAILTAAGYPDVPAQDFNHVFFGGRGTERFKGYGLFDTSINYDVPVFRSLRPWVKFDVFNLFNSRKLIAWNTTVSQDRTGPLDALGLATNFTRGPTFGTATGNTVTNLYSTAIPAYPLAFNGAPAGGRTVRVALGFRFSYYFA